MPTDVHAPRAASRPPAWPASLAPEVVVPLVEARVAEGPALVCDTALVRQRYRDLRARLPEVAVHYAVKCNPAPEVLATLAGEGAGFEIASAGELDAVVAAGADPARVLYSNPVKPPSHIADTYRRGVGRFAFDAEFELHKLARQAPGSRVYARVAVDDSTSRFPLSRKFGAPLDEAHRLLLLARDVGLVPDGLTFHVGSQCGDATAWPRAIARCGALIAALHRRGVRLGLLDIGGGLPATYTEPVPALDDLAAGIEGALAALPQRVETVVAEPGRFLVAESAVLVATVIGVDHRRGGSWAFLDVGGYNGMMEAVQTGGRWQFPLRTSRPDDATAPRATYTVTGPTCDSSDTMFHDAELPATLTGGDRVLIGSAGAYTLSYASSFNGFAPPRSLFIDSSRAGVGASSRFSRGARSAGGARGVDAGGAHRRS